MGAAPPSPADVTSETGQQVGDGRTGWLFEERYLWHDTGTSAGC